MRSTALLISITLAASLVACGETPPPATPPTPSATPDADLLHATPAQLKLAHFKSADGMHGFVLDRSGEPIKYQVDGSKDIVELTQDEDRKSGDLKGYWLTAPDGSRPLYISTGGGIRYFHGRDELPVLPDRKADALGAPTIKGKYVPPRPAYEATVERLKGVSVRVKMSAMKPEDSAKLDKIGEAIAQASAEMFVRYVARGQDSWLPRPVPVPDAFSGMEYGAVAHQTDEKWDPTAKGLVKWGGKLKGFSQYNSRGNHMQVMKMAGYPPKLADGTPGIVWEVDGTTAVFVTLDGGRYTVDLSGADKGQTLEPGAGPEARWPAPLQAALLDVHWVSSYAKAGAMPQKAIDDLTKLDDQWNECAQKTWKGAEKKIDSHKFTEGDRKEWVLKVERACKKSVDAQEKVFLQLIEARAKERSALHEKAKARVAAVGANK